LIFGLDKQTRRDFFQEQKLAFNPPRRQETRHRHGSSAFLLAPQMTALDHIITAEAAVFFSNYFSPIRANQCVFFGGVCKTTQHDVNWDAQVQDLNVVLSNAWKFSNRFFLMHVF